MRIVVTGSSGLLGSHIANTLRAAHDVLGLDLRDGAGTDLRCDLRRRREVLAAFSRADAVVHAAALHAPHLDHHDAEAFYAANVTATRHVLAAARAAGAAHFVFTSSTSVYGHALESETTVWVDETLTPLPRDAYDDTKLEAEARVIAAGDSMRCTVLRMARCFAEPARDMAVYRLHRGVDRRDVSHAVACALGLCADAHAGTAGRPGTASPGAATPGAATYVISGPTPFVHDDLDELGTAPAALISRRCPDEARQFDARGWRWPARIDRVYCPALARRQLGYRPRYGLAALLAGDCDPSPLNRQT